MVIGGGEVAERKVESLLAAGALVTVVSPSLSTGLTRLVSDGGIRHLARVFRRGDLAGATLAFAATDDCRGAAASYLAQIATATDTLVILMGLGNLGRIARELIAHGRAPETPVALVRAGTTSTEETITGVLADIEARAAAAALEPPVVIVVGDVVSLRTVLVSGLDHRAFSRLVVDRGD